jgi:heme/copper-type cytochrome/quinol oxidase subunit 4
MTKWIVRVSINKLNFLQFLFQTKSAEEWNLVFYISTVIALIPVVVFTLWGSAEVQE